MARTLVRIVGALVVWATLTCGAIAQENTAAQAAWEAAVKVAREGPVDVPFSDQAVLHLPAGMAYIPLPEASTLSRTWGNAVGERFRGLVVPANDTDQWTVFIEEIDEGFVKDDDAKSWDADELLQSLRDGTEAQNEERLKMGLPALDVVGWVQPPAYDVTAHRLVWSIKMEDRGAPQGTGASVNYNTYALGRDGYFEINLATGLDHIEADKPAAYAILSAFAYNQGKRYADFNEETDHIAEYGLAALIGGIAAKKLGFLALAAVFLAKFAKVILIGAAVMGGVIFKFFRRGKADS